MLAGIVGLTTGLGSTKNGIIDSILYTASFIVKYSKVPGPGGANPTNDYKII